MIAKLIVYCAVNLFLSGQIHCYKSEKNGKIIFAQVIFRHGARNPTADQMYPTDPYNTLADWTGGWGELTKIGKRENYNLGQWLRIRYNHLFGKRLNQQDIYLRSTDEDRIVVAAQATLAGFNMSPNISSIYPINTVPVGNDNLLSAFLPTCPVYQKVHNQYFQSAEIQRFNKTLLPLYEYLTNHTGMKINSFLLLSKIRDTFYIEDSLDLVLPKWTEKVYPDHDELYYGALESFFVDTGTDALAKLRSGYLLKEILDRAANKTLGHIPDILIYMYSTHDINMLSFLNTLGIFDNTFVEYAASIQVELELHDRVPFLKIYYRNGGILNLLYIPNCGLKCPLAKMYELYADILPSQSFQVACNN